MKKFLLLSLALGFIGFAVAQKSYVLKPEIQATQKVMLTDDKVGIEPAKSMTITGTKVVPPTHKGTRDLTIFAIGEAANAYGYGYAGGQKTILWVNNDLNCFINLHRETAATYSGNLAIDITLDRGDSFENNVRLYESTISGGDYNIDAARYPQGAIYNPPGNMDPANAYYAYFAPSLDGSNSADSWGSYSYGVGNLVDHGDTTKHFVPSRPADGIYQYIPDGFTITTNNVAMTTDFNQDWTTGTVEYKGEILMNRGIWNSAENDYEYEEILIECETIDNSRPACDRIAFAPDGMTGWIVALGNNGSIPFTETSYFPILFKTTDGGESWEDPISVSLGGPDGIDQIVYDFLTDAQLEELFEPPIPDRDEIVYTTAFDCDLVVDANGNPHIGVIVGVEGSDPGSIVSAAGFFGAFDITTWDGGENWTAYHFGNCLTFRGDFGDLSEDNRINISRTEDGYKVFVSWLDTHFEGYEDNIQPDIFCAGIDLMTMMKTETSNVTEFTEAWLQAFFFVAPEYVFDDGDTYTVPFTYEDMDPADPAAPVTFMYISDWSYSQDDFATLIGVPEATTVSNNLTVAQNYPNPFDQTTVISVELNETEYLSLEVYNLMGQMVYAKDAGQVNGSYEFILNADNLNSGVYFYTVRAGETSVSRKMIVE